MSPRIVFARTTASIHHGNRTVRIAEGDPWYATDPFVQAHPDMFDDTPVRVYGTEPIVEQATASPGEKRGARK